MALLEIKDLTVEFQSRRGVVRAVDGISFSLEKGKTLGLVGESGSGKSVSATAIPGLLDKGGRVVKGEILFMGQELVGATEKELQAIRGDRISMIFQEPMTALNPVLSVGRQMKEPFFFHRGASSAEAYRHALAMLAAVGIADPEGMMRRYPHALSGGQRQRVMIAMALACHPDLLIADEPTTALDVTVQAEILALLRRLQRENRMALLFITHDLAVIREMADSIAVIYCGRVVERAPTHVIFGEGPYRHPYTEGLLACRPTGGRMQPIREGVPPLHDLPKGCKFAPRCPYATPLCEKEPPLFHLSGGQSVRCYYPKKEARQDAVT